MLSLSAASTGLTLTASSDIVFAEVAKDSKMIEFIVQIQQKLLF